MYVDPQQKYEVCLSHVPLTTAAPTWFSNVFNDLIIIIRRYRGYIGRILYSIPFPQGWTYNVNMKSLGWAG